MGTGPNAQPHFVAPAAISHKQERLAELEHWAELS